MDPLFQALGFQWDRSVIPTALPVDSPDRMILRTLRKLPEFVWDAGVLEGNPITFPEVQTLLEGVTVGGHKLSDQEQILNLAESFKRLFALVRLKTFALNKAIFCELHAIVARHEALEWGHFRGEGEEKKYTPFVALGEFGHYTPPETDSGAYSLQKIFAAGVSAIQNEIQSPLESACAFFLFGALQQFFFDGNKRTSRLMMNGILLSNGFDSISIPAAKAQEFNEKMVRFYLTKNATEMMQFLLDCRG